MRRNSRKTIRGFFWQECSSQIVTTMTTFLKALKVTTQKTQRRKVNRKWGLWVGVKSQIAITNSFQSPKEILPSSLRRVNMRNFWVMPSALFAKRKIRSSLDPFVSLKKISRVVKRWTSLENLSGFTYSALKRTTFPFMTKKVNLG